MLEHIHQADEKVASLHYRHQQQFGVDCLEAYSPKVHFDGVQHLLITSVCYIHSAVATFAHLSYCVISMLLEVLQFKPADVSSYSPRCPLL